MVDFGESDKMIKISGKSNTYNEFTCNISFFINRTSSESVNKERNITTRSYVSVWFIHFSVYINIYIYNWKKKFNLVVSL